MKIAILGYGKQGKSAFDYWNPGNEITICDRNTELELPEGAKAQLGEHHLESLDKFDLIVRSPIVHPRDIMTANNASILEKVTTVTNEFVRVCPTKNIIGVTGTKGKGTTSTLVAKMLEALGHKVHVGGNIGTPPLDLLKGDDYLHTSGVGLIERDDYVVLELANFQLIDFRERIPLAVCLMVVPEHLDWHADMAEYVSAKQQLFKQQTNDDIAIYNASSDWSYQIAGASKGQKIPFMKNPGADVINGEIIIENQKICDASELKLLGRHNWQNVCAAVTAIWQISQNVEAIRSVLTSFSGLEHRLELVRELDGVKYYDDSFGTTPETAIVAIEAFDSPKIVILGGSDKGASYDEMAETIAQSDVKKVLLIGDQATRIQAALDKAGYSSYAPGGRNMTEIIANAKAAANPDDVVLLSPACASFDMFKSYQDRGDQFKAVVASL